MTGVRQLDRVASAEALVRQRSGSSTFASTRAIVWLAALAALYFGLLALINAHVFPASYALVAAAEGVILAAGLALIARTGLQDIDGPPLTLLFVFAILAVLLSLVNDVIFPDPLRNVAIIAVFTMIGSRARMAAVDRAFLLISALTLAVLIIELASTELYVAIFKPASFFQNFRGFEPNSWDESGLFANALSFESRWSFGLFSHRASSLFTEQVSLANYAGVLVVYLLARWNGLGGAHRMLQITTVTLILLSNSSRTSTFIAVASLPAFFIYPRLPRYGTLVLAPLFLIISFGLIGLLGMSDGDDLLGRLSVTVRELSGRGPAMWLGGEVSRAPRMLDTGYGYLVVSSSLLGLVAIWLYVSLIVPQKTDEGKRCGYGLAMYVFANLLIGGTAVFAMKVAAPLWLLVGAVRREDARG